MVHVYAANITALPDPIEYPQIFQGLWQERIDKALRCAQALKRKQSAGASLLLKEVLKRHGTEGSKLMYGHKGKPFTDGLCFSLSHSEDMVICAVGESAIGCDIEKLSVPREKVAARYFAAAELEYLNSLSPEDKAKAFFRIWTMKESYLKMTGEGLSVPLDSFYVRIGEDISIIRHDTTCTCRVKEYDIEGYCLSVCSEDEEFSQGLEFIELCAL